MNETNKGQIGKRSCHSCRVCKKTFKAKGRLDAHMKIHTGELRFPCDVCVKGFVDEISLKVHKLIHTRKLPFSCNECEKVFVCKYGLDNHMRIHTGERPFSCEVCGKAFKVKDYLNKHMTMHTGERPFSCKVCGKAFKLIGHLNKHMSIHSREQPTNIDESEDTMKFEISHVELKEKHTGEKLFMGEDINMSNIKKEIPCKDVEYESHTGSDQITSASDPMMIMSAEFIKTEPSDMGVIYIKDEKIDIKEEFK